MRVALVHDFLNQYGGAERVLEAIHELYPFAPVYTSLYDPTKLPLRIKNWDVRPFRLPKIPLAKAYTFFYPLLFENLDLSAYDLVISSTSGFAKGVLTRPGGLHLSYIHTPPRWLYGYPTETNLHRWRVLRPFLAPLDTYLRIWDYHSAQRPHFLIANSQETARRIRKFYRRDSTVIYPPVELRSQRSEARGQKGENYFLIVSRLVLYKRIELAIEAANRLGVPLWIVGTGREEKRLRRLAGAEVRFLGFVGDDRLSEIYQNCQALILPAMEDFGITPVEAMSFGKPVIALAKGGVLETVIPGKTGEFFFDESADSLAAVLEKFDPRRYKPEDCRRQARKFSKDRFKKEFSAFVEKTLILKPHARITRGRNN